MVEGARLESVYTRKGIAGSNPALSASQRVMVPSSLTRAFFVSGSVANLFAKADGNEKGRTQCGTIALGLKPPYLRDRRSAAEAIPPSPQDRINAPGEAWGTFYCGH